MVAYAMGITELDPLKHGLIFERFLNPSVCPCPISTSTSIPKAACACWAMWPTSTAMTRSPNA